MENKSPELEVAIKAALEAGKILEKHFETDIFREYKEDNSPVTLADRESEELIKKMLAEQFPTYSFFGEESGMTEHKSDYVWHVDPIDGTKNFANGIPLFAISIALVLKNELILGVVYNPPTHSMCYAEKGKGAYLNDVKISVSKDDARHAIMTVSRGKKDEDEKLFKELMYKFPRNVVFSSRDIGCAALDLTYIARGGTEVNIQLGLSTYDFAAGIVLVQEAGGRVTDIKGQPYQFPDNHFIASNGVFHDLIVEQVKIQKEKLGLK